MPSPPTDPPCLDPLGAAGAFDGALPDPCLDRLTQLALSALSADEVELTLAGPSHPVVSRAGRRVGGDVAATVPFLHPDGSELGALTVRSAQPRQWSRDDLVRLGDVAALATTEVALRLVTQKVDADRVRMGAIVETALDAIIVMEPDGTLLEFNPAAEALLGYTREEAVGSFLHDLIVPPSHRAAHLAGVARNTQTGVSRILDKRLELPALRADGTEVPVELTVTRTEVGGAIRFIGFLRDLSAQRALDVAEARIKAVVNAAPMILFAFDMTGRITLSQGTGLASLGLESDEAVGGSIFDFYTEVPSAQKDLQRALSGERFTAVAELGDFRYETHYRPIHDLDGVQTDVVGVTLDVTDRRRSEMRIAHLAYHDQLTGLANRAGLETKLAVALAHAEAAKRAAALLYVDLDDFKTVNDSLGHEAGDQILREAADRLASVTRQGDLLSRQGGDEFLLFLDDLGTDAQATSEAAARRAIEAFEAPFRINGLEFQLGATIGVSLFPRDGTSFGELLRNADVAMYQAKRSGRGVHSMYEAGSTDPRGRLTLGTRLRRALAQEEFVLFYQPIVALRDGSLTGMEALIRWRDPERGLLLPGDFIPAAEETGRIVEIGAWVADAASRQLRAWDRLGYDVAVSFNVSPVQLRRKGFAMDLAETFARNGVAPGRMIAEITEAVAMEDVAATTSVFAQLADLGVQLAVDDFGAGHSSLTRLRRLPFTVLKIDRALMAGVDADPAALAVVTATLALAKALGLRTIAEGVETEGQRQRLKAHGCELAQGFGLARPMPGPEATELLRLAGHPGRAPAYAGLKASS